MLNADNLAGVLTVALAAREQVSRVPDRDISGSEITAAVVFNIGTFNAIPIVKGTWGLTVKPVMVGKDEFFAVELAGEVDVPELGDAPTAEASRYRYIVDVVCISGDRFLLGTLEDALRFSYEHLNGNRPGEYRGYRARFTGTFRERPPYYRP
jgi:hypothetical protein